MRCDVRARAQLVLFSTLRLLKMEKKKSILLLPPPPKLSLFFLSSLLLFLGIETANRLKDDRACEMAVVTGSVFREVISLPPPSLNLEGKGNCERMAMLAEPRNRAEWTIEIIISFLPSVSLPFPFCGR